jgi:hypothetical protein
MGNLVTWASPLRVEEPLPPSDVVSNEAITGEGESRRNFIQRAGFWSES